ncbi:hypothetical protein PR202_gb14586 [Eleusine coracana subsp. coracana]|uniref:SAUR family protein n=1 Tax=Eleusine coracana subsp. coracana TaxID=191504 RepID=A0AAV5EVR9_ELECO|nr:hypothetical protein PR202_gb14586 [Eleusine coracana subsp. coracana]
MCGVQLRHMQGEAAAASNFSCSRLPLMMMGSEIPSTAARHRPASTSRRGPRHFHIYFITLLKRVEDEFGFDHRCGSLTIPCASEDDFANIVGSMEDWTCTITID